MADDLRERVARAIHDVVYQDPRFKNVSPFGPDSPLYDRNLAEADAAISACDPIDTATGLTWKERFLERAERCAQAEVERDTIKARYATPYNTRKRDRRVSYEVIEDVPSENRTGKDRRQPAQPSEGGS